MTVFSDNIYTGNLAATSAASSKSRATYCRVHRFTGGGSSTQTGTFPQGTMMLDAKVWILAQTASAATATRFTVSAGGVNLIAVTGIGSALGVLRTTTAGLGVITNTASATSILTGAASSELSYSVTMVGASGDTTGDFHVALEFTRRDTDVFV